MLLLPDTDSTTAATIAETLRQQIMECTIAHDSSSAADVVTVSFGVAATVPELTSLPGQLVEQADTALYRAKNKGRNRVVVAEG